MKKCRRFRLFKLFKFFKFFKFFRPNGFSALLLLLLGLLLPGLAAATTEQERLAKGEALAFDRNAGNCLSCHVMAGGELPGNIGPPLIQMRLRFPDREVLRAQIWDAAVRNPDTLMPPYGRHSVISEEEIDQVVDYIHTL
jgi:L-cysteine S-thiosulfotransferase